MARVTITAKAGDTVFSSVALFESRAAAGFPAPGDDLVEASLNLHTHVVKNPTATFFVRVEGDSMEGIGIYSGDILVVDRSVTPRSGSVVVAVVDGGLVVKELQKTLDGMALVSANESYSPILLDEGSDCYVWGVVTASVRQF